MKLVRPERSRGATAKGGQCRAWSRRYRTNGGGRTRGLPERVGEGDRTDRAPSRSGGAGSRTLRHRPVRAAVLVLLMAATLGLAAERTFVEGILIRVNDRIVTLTDFKNRLDMELSQRPEKPMGDELVKFVRSLYEAVLEEQIMLERAAQEKVTVDEKDVDRAIDALRKQNHLEDDATFKKALEEAGLNEKMLRNRYRQSMLLQRVAQREVGKIEITSAEAHEEYEKEKERFKTPPKVELQQLFFPISDDGKDREAVLQRARGLVARVRGGGDLEAEATLAGVELTDLGAIPEKDLRPELREALAKLKEGQITDPLETVGGFQVLRLVKRIPAGYRPFEEVEPMLRRKLAQERYQEQTKGLVEKLKKEYLVEVHPELLDMIVPGAGDGTPS